MRCQHTLLDGAYVLGALAPGERRDFAEHLEGCVQCSTSVRELAGVPGLLAQVNLADLEALPAPPQVPSTLLPTLVRGARRSHHRRMALVAAVAASVTAVVVGALAVDGALDDEVTARPAQTSVTQTPTGVPMLALGPTPVSAEILVSSVPWGTRLDLTCSYESEAGSPYGDSGYGASSAPEYALVVRTRDGRTDEVATWRGLPGRTMQLSAATATPRSDIEAVEVHTADGTIVLRSRI